ncbi:MAG: MBL fold metallo-hydrolase [bacterium]|nr:MBL fold metallo-hydrolase [bacterium]
MPLFWLTYNQPRNLEVDFLDVGQGDAILIKTPGGQNVLIDGGPDKTVVKRLGENLAWWDKRIDLMILTHPHDDQTS